MNKQIETIMALAEMYADGVCTQGYFDDHRGALIAALEAALKPGEAQCKWPTCQTEEYQQKLGDDVVSELIGAPPAQTQTPPPRLTVDEKLQIALDCNMRVRTGSGAVKFATAIETAVRKQLLGRDE